MQPIILKQPHFLVLNKPSGIHSDEAAQWCAAVSGDRALQSWTCAHRLDQPTTGCLLLCPETRLDEFLSMFKKHSQEFTRKSYLAETDSPYSKPLPELSQGFICARYRRSKSVRFLYQGDPALEYQWHSKSSVSHEVKSPETPLALQELGLALESVQIELHSGARHQIRAFLASQGHPIAGDKLYGSARKQPLGLHAWKLAIKDPDSGQFFEAVASKRYLKP